MSERPNPSTIPEVILSQLEQNQTTFEPHRLAMDLLKAGLNTGDFERSVGGCHVEGLSSIVLFDRSEERDGMVRFYYAEHGRHNMAELYDTSGNYRVGIHDHKYPLAIVPLVGDIVNVSTEESDNSSPSQQLFEYRFTSALTDGNLSTMYRRQRTMKPHDETLLLPGAVYLMQSSDLHTVIVPEPETSQPGTAWMVIEGPRQQKDTVIYSPRADFSIETEGLYNRLPRAESIKIAETVFDLATRG